VAIEKRKTILIVISNYLPGFKLGGPIASISNLVNSLSNDFNFKILTSDRDFGDNKPYPNVDTNTWSQKDNYQILYLKRNLLTLYNLIRKINSTAADILYLNSFFDPLFSISVIIAKKMGLLKIENIVIAPRGELFREAINFKREKKILYLKFARIFGLYDYVIWHATSAKERTSVLESLKVMPDKIRIAMIISSLFKEESSFEKNEAEPDYSNEKSALRIVFLSRVSKDKNLKFTLNVLQKVNSDVIFDIYGPIEDKYIWDACQEEIKKMPSNISVKYFGSVDRENVKNIFSQYDLFFLPSVSENFGHVIVESLSVGTPVLLSDKTPWRNLEEKGWGWDLSLEDPNMFVETIHQMAMYPKSYFKKKRHMIKNSFNEYLRNPEILIANKELFNISSRKN
jgi:glycosyltransferase involved in cell wall biosynthesis